MDLGELNKMSNREIVEGISRTAGTPIEKGLQAELMNRQITAMNALAMYIADLKKEVDNLKKGILFFCKLNIFIIIVIATSSGFLAYYFFAK
ncbi:MAG: hypothetical protein HY810_09820 [Candidatus Omnitrophica bacterium]|nr:hypothetical protein [Candidatus Omnitrophota bacterium]